MKVAEVIFAERRMRILVPDDASEEDVKFLAVQGFNGRDKADLEVCQDMIKKVKLFKRVVKI